MNSSDIARICHEANRSYCLTIGDKSQLPWDEIPASKKVSTIKGVELALQDPNLTPEESHRAWSDEKTSNGWKYGEVRDDEKKIHPSLVNFEQLPIEQQLKDKLFIAIVRSLAG